MWIVTTLWHQICQSGTFGAENRGQLGAFRSENEGMQAIKRSKVENVVGQYSKGLFSKGD